MQKHPYSVLTSKQVKGRLIFTPCPGTKDTSVAEALDTLKEADACALLTLMPTEELTLNEVENLERQCQQRSIEWFHLPVEDGHAPGEPFQAAWSANRERIKQLLTEGKSIAIHCKGGSGRTGLVAAQLLIECGVPFSDAVSGVQALRPSAIQHPVHINYISQFGR
ncbi:cyclin-dependent kinase inhibitor 3 family protein [Pseudomonas sp. A2]|uniref:cyclin-dependent kinase inhibitor 3 family protein n=1 Tax=Pseudomonas sp. A2 TaxID=107445 RepID=UPI002C79D6EC|nr:cyclin-dependent kinase inhibitor 3 family protein [Pseudomonas sp. A2]MEB3438056.1 cyclin-dependent kinase inhibitor 3 family protein [Pseudomonas sp. A2]